jgi:hypothetical protein
MMFTKQAGLSFIFLLSFCKTLYAEEPLISGTIKCTAEWNELCEDKKILSVPAHYRLCHHNIRVAEKTGDAGYQVVASDQSSITVYFRAKGNQDRFKPQGANIQLDVKLLGTKDTEACEESAAKAQPVVEPATPALSPPPAEIVLTPPPAPTANENITTPHACACSQYLNWIKVENCLAREKRDDRPPCDSYEVTIQCVASREQCRSLQKDNCPQVVGLNQSTSFKRLYIENSPYCQP